MLVLASAHSSIRGAGPAWRPPVGHGAGTADRPSARGLRAAGRLRGSQLGEQRGWQEQGLGAGYAALQGGGLSSFLNITSTSIPDSLPKAPGLEEGDMLRSREELLAYLQQVAYFVNLVEQQIVRKEGSLTTGEENYIFVYY